MLLQPCCIYQLKALCLVHHAARSSLVWRIAQIEVLWRTEEMRVRKPSVLEEVQTGLDYFRLSLFDAVCTTYRYAENSLQVSVATNVSYPSAHVPQK